MKVCTNKDGRIICTSEDFNAGPDEFEFDFPEGFDFSKQSDYRIVDGELINDPAGPTPEERASSLRSSIAKANNTITDTYANIMSGSVTEEQAQACAAAMDNRAAWVAELSEIEAGEGESAEPPSYEKDAAGAEMGALDGSSTTSAIVEKRKTSPTA